MSARHASKPLSLPESQAGASCSASCASVRPGDKNADAGTPSRTRVPWPNVWLRPRKPRSCPGRPYAPTQADTCFALRVAATYGAGSRQRTRAGSSDMTGIQWTAERTGKAAAAAGLERCCVRNAQPVRSRSHSSGASQPARIAARWGGWPMPGSRVRRCPECGFTAGGGQFKPLRYGSGHYHSKGGSLRKCPQCGHVGFTQDFPQVEVRRR